MKIGVAGSMHKTEDLLKYRDELIGMGHDAFVTSLASPFLGKTDEEKESIKLHQKNNPQCNKGVLEFDARGSCVTGRKRRKRWRRGLISAEIHSSKWALLTC